MRGEVAARLLAARVAGDPALVEAAASGPAAALEQLRVRVDGPQPDAVALAPAPATVLVAPQVDGWPRWFATVTDPPSPRRRPGRARRRRRPRDRGPTAEPTVVPDDAAGVTTDPAAEPSAADGEPSLPADAEGTGAPVAAEPPGARGVRRGRRPVPVPALGAAHPAARGGPARLRRPRRRRGAARGRPRPADVGGPSGGPSADPSGPTADSDPEPTDPAAAERAELLAVLDDLAVRYAAVMTDGDASEFAAEFQPDAFVEAVRARAAAEREAVADVAGTEAPTPRSGTARSSTPPAPPTGTSSRSRPCRRPPP